MDPRSSPFTIPPDALVAHAAFVRRIARAMLGNDADADDATQETLVAGLASGPRDAAATRGWLAAVTRNVARRLRRRETRTTSRDRSVARSEGAASVVDTAARQEALRAVIDAIAALQPDAREVVLLRHYDDLPPREIAARLGLSVEAVKKRLSRAHEALRLRLEGGGRREETRRRGALAVFAGVPFEPSAGGDGAGAAGVAAKGVAMARSAKSMTIAAVAVLAAGAGVWTFARRTDDAGPRSAATPAETASEPGAPPPLAGGRRVTPAAEAPATVSPAIADTKPAVPKDWIGYQHGRVRFRCPREWVDHSYDGPTVPIPPEICRFVAPIEGGGSLTWTTVPPKEADTLSTKLTEATEAPVAIGSRAAIERRGLATSGGSAVRVRILRLATFEGFDEPFVFVATMPVAAPAGVDETIDVVRGTLTVTPLPRAVAAAIGEVPGNVIELAAFVDGSPAYGVAALVQWLSSRGVNELEDDGSPHIDKKAGPTSSLDASGRVRFEELSGGESYCTYEVLVSGPSIGSHRVFAMVPGAARVRYPRLVLTLGTGAVRGRAFARDGRPAVGATVVFRAGGGAYGSLIVTGEAVVDAEGNYELRGLPLGSGGIELQLPKLDGVPQAPRRRTVVVADATPVTLDLGDAQPLAFWRGRVVDVRGRPISGPGTLSLARLVSRPGAASFEGAIVLRDARIEARVEPGKYRVSGRLVRPTGAPRYIDVVDVEVPPSGLERDLVVGGGTVVLRVRRANGDVAAPGVELWLDRPGETRTASYGASTDPEGRARFSGLPAGRYRVLAGRPFGDGAPAASLAEVEVSDPPVPTELDVRLPVPDSK